MDPVKNFYLSECPAKRGLKNLKRLIGIYDWRKTEKIKKTTHIVSNSPITPTKKEKCFCDIMYVKGNFSAESKPHLRPSSPNGKKYNCHVKTHNDPKLADILEKYFSSNKILVDKYDRDV